MNQINIKIVGVGGGGVNVINHMIDKEVKDIDFIVANTDKQSIDQSLSPNKLFLGVNTLNGQGASMDPLKGKKAALESLEEIKGILEGSDIVFISAGLGGGTGTGAAPIIAQAAKEIGALTIAIVTSPFRFEGRKRTKLAKEGLGELKRESDSVVVVPNESLLPMTENNLGIKESFKLVDKILTQAVCGISKVMLSHRENDIILDFADVKTVMDYKGLALMGTGYSKGTNAAYDAVKDAIKSPLLDNISIDGARGVLVNFDIHPDYPVIEIRDAMDIVEESADKDASVIFVTTADKKMNIDEVRITLVATGLEDNTEIISHKESMGEYILDVPAYSRRYPDIGIIETINIWWEGPFSPADIKYSGIPMFLRKQIDTLDTKSTGSYDELTLYLVYNLVGAEWAPLYVGMTTDELYKIHAKWDIGSGQDMDTLMIYKGTLLNQKYVSLKAKKQLKKAEALINNILVDPSISPQEDIIGNNMILLRNLNIEERLYPLLKSKYYWEDGLAFDIVERNHL